MKVYPRLLQGILFLLISAFVMPSLWAQDTVVVSGKVEIPSNGVVPEGGLDVVLLKFGLNEQGGVQPEGPVGRIKSDASGNFSFGPMALPVQAAYQLGSRYQGNLVSSSFFFVKPGEAEKVVNIDIPEVTENVEALTLESTALVVEPGIGMVKITELQNVVNPTTDVIDSSNKPFRFNLPPNFSNFEVMQEGGVEKYETKGNSVEFFRQFPPGRATLAYVYHLDVPLGQLELVREYLHDFEGGRVLSPSKQMEMTSTHLKETDAQKLGELEFRTWTIGEIPNKKLVVQLSGVALEHTTYLYMGMILFLAFIVVLILFFRLRLSGQEMTPATS